MKIKGPIRALGAMSGTSLDGIDGAVLVTRADSPLLRGLDLPFATRGGEGDVVFTGVMTTLVAA